MRSPLLFLRGLAYPPRLAARSTPAEQQRTERVVATARLFFSGLPLLSIWVDPALLASHSVLTYSLIAGYFAAAALIWARLRGAYVPSRPAQIVWHAGDVAWTAMVTQITEGPNSPFSLLFMFVLLSAAYRWGFLETIGTATVAVALLVAQFMIDVDSAARVDAGSVELNRLLMRTLYLAVAGALLGYLAEEERYRRLETVIVGRLAANMRVETGVWATFETVAAELLSVFSARNFLLLWTESQSGRQFLWTAVRTVHGVIRVESTEVGAADRERYRMETPGAAWRASSKASLFDESSKLLALDDVGRRIEPQRLRLPREWIERYQPDRVLGVTVNIPAMGSGLVLIFDPCAATLSAVRFLQRLAKQLAPVLYSVYLLLRLRSRIGALERARIARELHDGVVQSLIALQMEMDALRHSARDRAAVNHDLGRIQDLLAREVHDLRDLINQLEPVDFKPGELVAYLQELVDRFQRDTGIAAAFVSDVNEVTLSPVVCHELARITREALVNVRKHSGARNVLVRFSAVSGEHKLSIANDGRVFDFTGRLSLAELDSQRKGPGVIKARVRAIGGELTIDSSADEGVRVEVTVRSVAAMRQKSA